MMRILAMIALAGTVLVAIASAGVPPELEPFRFLVGEWQASGSGEPGTGSGTAVFAWGLQGRVILRTSFAEYPADGAKPASRHDDLMIIHVEAGNVRADYYDSEGHVIRYAAASPAPGKVVFSSEAASGEPRFRLSYKLEDSVLSGEFAIAPPDAPDAFQSYLTWHSARKAQKD